MNSDIKKIPQESSDSISSKLSFSSSEIDSHAISPSPIPQQSAKVSGRKKNLLLLNLLSVIIIILIIIVQFFQNQRLFDSTVMPLVSQKQVSNQTATAVTIQPHSVLLPPALTATSMHSQLFSPTPTASSLTHFIGGFGIETDAEIANAEADGIRATIVYGYTPQKNDALSLKLQAHNLKIIDAMPWEYLYYYECHMNSTCPASEFPELTTPQAVFNDLIAHLKQVQNDPSIVGYWVLDDWSYGDGTGKDFLVQMNRLIHYYTPGKPSICGFGAGILPRSTASDYWNDGTAANFSPQGCDMVGLYIYADSNTTGTYDWTMSQILPTIFASLKKRGWDSTKEPLIGIPQAFGGTVGSDQWPIPDANNIETQSKTYCQQGATGIIYYQWVDTSEQSPMNNAQITQGIKNGIADCLEIWQ